MRCDGRRFSDCALIADHDDAGRDSGSRLQRIARGPDEFAHLCDKIECRVHGAFSVILVRLGVAE